MALDYSKEPLYSTPSTPQKLVNQPWFDVNTPKTIYVCGQKRAGKGVAMDWMIERMYRNGITVIHLFSAGGFENLYYVVTKKCRERWAKELELHPERQFELGCKCHSTIPILWMIPEYIEMKQDTVDRFNGVYWSNWNEYNEAYIKGYVNEFLPNFYDVTKLKKPKRIRPKEVFATMKFPPPTTPKRIEEFRPIFREMVLRARAEHRILVNSPSIYPNTHAGKVQRYSTVAEAMRYLPELSQKDFAMLKMDKPRDQWTKYEKSWHKLCIIANEVRALAPSQRLSGDPESSVSKKAWFNFLPESRHNKSWVLFDLQSPADMFVGVRNQVDLRIIKRSTPMLLGDDLGWFLTMIQKKRENLIEKLGGYSPEVLGFVDKKYPRITEIPDNKGYVLFGNGEFKLIKFDTPSWHHKSDKDDFFADTGIDWVVNTDTEEKSATSEKSEKARQTKQQKEDEYRLVDVMRGDGKSFDDIIKHFVKNENDKGNSDSKWHKENKKNLSNKFNSWKKKQKV